MIQIRALPGACRASTAPGLSDFGFPDWFGTWSHRVFRRSPRIIGMKRYDAQISFAAVVERIAPEVPRYVVYSGEAWDETGTFLVEVALNGIPIGLRSMIPWKDRDGILDCRNRYAARWGWRLAIACKSKCAGLEIPDHKSYRNSWTTIAGHGRLGSHYRPANSATSCCLLPVPRNPRLVEVVQDGCLATDAAT